MAEPVLAAAGERAVPDGGVPRRGLDTPSKFAGPSTSSGSGTLVHDPAVSAQPPEGAEVRRSRSEVPSSPRQPGPQGETLPIRFLTLQSYAGLPIEALPVPPMLYPPYVGPATPQNPMQSYDSVQANIQTPYYVTTLDIIPST
ncbi:hypothetical protein GLOTRDRAFT_115112 [Gloeophyllum trabeum ATCC 11539]|uniref:Uncharacterized protein n=1 Tax=Gloeophyllum trabeum (strain ATCC 11539 / FP-39264 / Madison 617) TaxID=670483 RepID=S7QCG0_GLOTA|nr:uncharacterized protein GLOTRDRAFT_115112 [Gloeophyllum trabeum ATCC 11539]EPQ57017.1 hypothetical protein GLOTRDRAFT_115112 [Gloeophyllum trabeum ATCC 11539]